MRRRGGDSADTTDLWVRYISLATFTFVIIVCVRLAMSALTLLSYSLDWNDPGRYEACQRLAPLEPGLCLLATLGVELILAIRVWSVWARDRKILAMLAALILAETAFLIVGAIATEAAPAVPGALSCVAAAKAGKRGWVGASSFRLRRLTRAVGYFTAPAIVDAIMLAMLVYRTVQIKRETVRRSSPRPCG